MSAPSMVSDCTPLARRLEHLKLAVGVAVAFEYKLLKLKWAGVVQW